MGANRTGHRCRCPHCRGHRRLRPLPAAAPRETEPSVNVDELEIVHVTDLGPQRVDPGGAAYA